MAFCIDAESRRGAMPHTRSAKKNQRKSEKRRLHNKAVLRAVKKQIKAFLAGLPESSVEDARKQFSLTVKKLDKAAAKGVVHRNLAARKKSQLARKIAEKEKGTAPAKT
jgi:small subunit ribosomal protein S20